MCAAFRFSPHRIVSRNDRLPGDISFGSYGDPSVYTRSSKYASAPTCIQAPGGWHERTADHRFPGRNSTLTGPSTVSSAIEGPGIYLLAAPK